MPPKIIHTTIPCDSSPTAFFPALNLLPFFPSKTTPPRKIIIIRPIVTKIKSNIKLSYQTKAAPGNRNPLTNRNTQFLLNIF